MTLNLFICSIAIPFLQTTFVPFCVFQRMRSHSAAFERGRFQEPHNDPHTNLAQHRIAETAIRGRPSLPRGPCQKTGAQAASHRAQGRPPPLVDPRRRASALGATFGFFSGRNSLPPGRRLRTGATPPPCGALRRWNNGETGDGCGGRGPSRSPRPQRGPARRSCRP